MSKNETHKEKMRRKKLLRKLDRTTTTFGGISSPEKTTELLSEDGAIHVKNIKYLYECVLEKWYVDGFIKNEVLMVLEEYKKGSMDMNKTDDLNFLIKSYIEKNFVHTVGSFEYSFEGKFCKYEHDNLEFYMGATENTEIPFSGELMKDTKELTIEELKSLINTVRIECETSIVDGLMITLEILYSVKILESSLVERKTHFELKEVA